MLTILLSMLASSLSWTTSFRAASRVHDVLCRATRGDERWARRVPAEEPLVEGSVIAATPGSFDHYFLESLVLILEHSDEAGTVGVLLNHQTPWTVADMTEALGELGENILFLGGDAGRDTMVMLHDLPLLKGARQLGQTNLCLGGVSEAIDLVGSGQLRANKFKFL